MASLLVSPERHKKITVGFTSDGLSLNFFEFVLELLSNSAISSYRVSSYAVNLSAIYSSD